MGYKIDVFCEVIDNFGDVGVVFRLGKLLAEKHSVRIFIDSLKELPLLEPKCDSSLEFQIVDGIQYATFEYLKKNVAELSPSEIIIEAFGCNIEERYLEKAKIESSLLINLEYLSSEEWTIGFHGNESMLGAEKLRKFFFIPGLLEGTGGVLFDKGKIERLKNLSRDEKDKVLDRFLPDFSKEFRSGKKIGTLFSYEKNFLNLLEVLNSGDEETILLIMGEKSQSSMKKLITLMKDSSLLERSQNKEIRIESEKRIKNLLKNSDLEIFVERVKKFYSVKEDFTEGRWSLDIEEIGEGILRLGKIWICYYPFIPQENYDELIMLTDFNLVRGEDSFVRAALSGVPFLWHIYLQEDGVHLEKLQSFLDVYRDFFIKNYPGKYNGILESYEKIMIEYNDRGENSLEICNENFSLFLENLEILKEMATLFSDHVIKNHDLIEKLNRFIGEKML